MTKPANRFSLPGKACGYSFDHAPTGTQCRIVTEWWRELRPSGAGKGVTDDLQENQAPVDLRDSRKVSTMDKTSDGNTGICREQRKVTRWMNTSQNIGTVTDRLRHAFSHTEGKSRVTGRKRICAASQFFLESVGSWPVLSVEPEGVRSLESLREPANQVRGNREIIAVQGSKRTRNGTPKRYFVQKLYFHH